MQFRPSTTVNERWSGYWEVNALERLAKPDELPINLLSAFGSGERFQRNYMPHGPILIDRL